MVGGKALRQYGMVACLYVFMLFTLLYGCLLAIATLYVHIHWLLLIS